MNDLVRLALVFLTVGSVSFGGHMSMVAQIRRYVVERNGWLTTDEFSEIITLAAMLPGPMAVNVVAWCGFRARGWWGAIVSVVAVLLPSVLMMGGLTIGYVALAGLKDINDILGLISAIVGGMIISAGIRMISAPARNFPDGAFGLWRSSVFIISTLVSLSMPGYGLMMILMLITGVIGFWVGRMGWMNAGRMEMVDGENHTRLYSPNHMALGWGVFLLFLVTAWLFRSYGSFASGLSYFSQISLSLFGGGYSIVPLLMSVLVEGAGVLKESDVYLGVSLGQLTPGPILVSSVFYGFEISGWPGAMAATVGMFLPPAVLMILMAQWIQRFRRSKVWQDVFFLLKPCVAGLVLSAGISMWISHAEGWTWIHHLLLLVSFGLIHIGRTHPVWLIGLAICLGCLPL